ncbi:amidohydrolase/deacetylase family metallohydrolase [Edaphobacter albus]|uniref:amidohydrolase/deacetylase family metallohydrolase n=1 Tax=Edaphobacter sp. 4G125 TaxID=2763071 RepID=UPI0016448F80|nr:amidohydrolase/deacetylase family metallohydrolase [Edaphobacter sp. 4G125]QNI35611.1 amidohydrolase/deacetylase family metallohydrolase [Edaphobacter sp. 4G125]
MKFETRSFLLGSLCFFLSGGIQAQQPSSAVIQAQQQASSPRRFVETPNPLPYDLILAHGHVIDAKNHVDKVTDVAIKDGVIAKVGDDLNPKDAAKTVDVTGYYVTPGLIDIHMHMYATTGEKNSYAGDNSIWPDGFTLRNGVTTAVDAGSSGWRNFEDFKEHVIDRSHTRVLAMLNIVGAGMRPGLIEQNLDDMDGEATGTMALKYPGIIVGVKSAHFMGPEWKPYDQAVKAGNIANIPVMIDYGARRPERPLYDLLATHLRKGDIYTHAFSGHRGEQDPKTLKASDAMLIGRKRGIYFDAGTGGASFAWSVAIPLLQNGFPPDSLSTDLHITAMNSGTKDLLNVADKFLAMGQSIPTVIQEMTWNPAQEIRQTQLGNLSVGSPADIAVLSEEHGKFGFIDMNNTKLMGNTKLICQLTVRAGKIVYDLNGISMDMWNEPPSSDPSLSSHWTTFRLRTTRTANEPGH